jgi:SP family galactose:H+ symporter-like MFS transporter
MGIAIVVGTLLSGLLADKFGRKFTLILGQAIFAVCWSILFFAKDFQMLITGRFIMGIGCGINSPTVYMLLSEIALIRFRLQLI